MEVPPVLILPPALPAAPVRVMAGIHSPRFGHVFEYFEYHPLPARVRMTALSFITRFCRLGDMMEAAGVSPPSELYLATRPSTVSSPASSPPAHVQALRDLVPDCSFSSYPASVLKAHPTARIVALKTGLLLHSRLCYTRGNKNI